MTANADPLRQYLAALRSSLRGQDASLILAEAEDHLRESVAAGLAAGLTNHEAQEAAISSFGSVRAVVRAHQTRQARAAEAVTDVTMVTWKLAGLFLLAFSVSALGTFAGLAVTKPQAVSQVDLGASWPTVVAWVVAGIVGLASLAGHRLVRRFLRRRRHADPVLLARSFPRVAVILFGAAATGLVLLRTSGAVPVGRPPILATLALAAGYAVRTRTLRRHRKLA